MLFWIRRQEEMRGGGQPVWRLNLPLKIIVITSPKWGLAPKAPPLYRLSGVYSGICPGGLNFFLSRGGSAPVGAWKTPEINRFHWLWGGLSPYSPPPEYASGRDLTSSSWSQRIACRLLISGDRSKLYFHSFGPEVKNNSFSKEEEYK